MIGFHATESVKTMVSLETSTLGCNEILVDMEYIHYYLTSGGKKLPGIVFSPFNNLYEYFISWFWTCVLVNFLARVSGCKIMIGTTLTLPFVCLGH